MWIQVSNSLNRTGLEVEAQKEVTETDYFQLNRKDSSNITTGILMVFVVPAALGYGWLYLAPEMTELIVRRFIIHPHWDYSMVYRG